MMYTTVWDLSKTDPEFAQEIINAIVFEMKDAFTLNLIRHAIQTVYPGDYKILSWANVNDNFNISLNIEFKNKEDYMYWVLSL